MIVISKSSRPIGLNCLGPHLICLLLCLFSLHQSGCRAQNVNIDLSNNSSIDLNILEEKIKQFQPPRPENIPQVADWIEECKNKVGGRTFRVIRKSPSRMISCISDYIKYDKLKEEIADSMDGGKLDSVFKKYCGRRDPIMECIDDVLETVKPCLSDQQILDINITRSAIDAGIDFTCYENGDRIALFMAEDGIECLKNKTEIISACLREKLPEVNQIENKPKSLNLDQFVINDENCKKIATAHDCVVAATISCDDPTPSNILDSLITQAMKVTPCNFAQNASSGFYPPLPTLIQHFLTLIFAGLTAAHILL